MSVGDARVLGRGDNSILELARPPPASPHIVPRPRLPPANCCRAPRSRARDGGLEGFPTVTAAVTSALALGIPAFLLPSALGRRHRRFYFRPLRGSTGRPVPPRVGCGVIHTRPSHAAPVAPPLEPRPGNERSDRMSAACGRKSWWAGRRTVLRPRNPGGVTSRLS
uniref:Uncharacterized protein n=1 Tax=Molossus molossus TaxID=27622 RepID=A0A7J8IZM8_MOLMO|nr:hypothetical protein HJG59_010407 [Molossus molossus]